MALFIIIKSYADIEVLCECIIELLKMREFMFRDEILLRTMKTILMFIDSISLHVNYYFRF